MQKITHLAKYRVGPYVGQNRKNKIETKGLVTKGLGSSSVESDCIRINQ